MSMNKNARGISKSKAARKSKKRGKYQTASKYLLNKLQENAIKRIMTKNEKQNLLFCKYIIF